jgi:hypothetical protein
VEKIIGACVYEFETDRSYRFIYIFAKKREGIQEKLVFIRYDLETRKLEDTGPVELDLPEGTKSWSAVISQRNNSANPPELALDINYGNISNVTISRLNRQGNDFEPYVYAGGFVFHENAAAPPLRLVAMLSLMSRLTRSITFHKISY